MNAQAPKNLAQSVLDRLRNLARARSEDFNFLLTRYVGERLLHRLSRSDFSDRFVLKGATLLFIWSGRAHRPTRDVDLLGFGDPSVESVADVFRRLCAVAVQPDAVEFEAGSVRAAEIRDVQEYGGIRVHMRARIGTAVIPLQVDVGFGDVITPGVTKLTIESMLDLPATTVAAYPPETVVAEKLEALAKLGIANSRMKDFHDLWVLSQEKGFDLGVLRAAVRATFERRRTPLPHSWPLGLTEEFATDRLKLTQWNAFLNTHGFSGPKADLAEVVVKLRGFAGPPLGLLETEGQNWPPGGPWSR